MKSGKNNKSLKLFSATAVTLFSLTTAFVATIAWFALNENVDGSGMPITVTDEGSVIESVAIHRCILNQSTISTLVFDSSPETERLVVPDYSELNKSQPTLLLFALSGDENSMASEIKITANSTNTSYVTEITESNHNSFPFSTTVCFKTIAVTSATFPFNNVQSSNLSNLISFVTMGESVFTGFNQNITIFDGASMANPPEDPLTYVGVILDYYDEALQYLSACNTGNELRLGFEFDFSMSIA